MLATKSSKSRHNVPFYNESTAFFPSIEQKEIKRRVYSKVTSKAKNKEAEYDNAIKHA